MIPREPHVLAHFMRKDLNHYFAIVVEGCFPVAFVGQTALEDTDSVSAEQRGDLFPDCGNKGSVSHQDCSGSLVRLGIP